MDLKDKKAIVTGGSKGIGRHIALKFAEAGADVAVVYSSHTEEAEKVCAEIAAMGRTAEAYQLDVSDFAAAKETVAAIHKSMGRIDIVVNCAGITKDGLIAMMKEDNFDKVVSVNLKGTFNMIRHCTPIFMKQRYGKIINVTSVSGLIGNAGQANYSASKAGVVGLTKATAKELAGRGVCCNAIAPGFIATEMTANIGEDNPLIGQIPMGRMGQPEEVAELALFLASGASDYITGEVIRIDGGIAM